MAAEAHGRLVLIWSALLIAVLVGLGLRARSGGGSPHLASVVAVAIVLAAVYVGVGPLR